MTELFIDGYPVELPEDFDIDFFIQNPFFTKNGEFTYDIDIHLKSANNAKLYKHIHRLHSTNVFKNRRAILISNGSVLINGLEIILNIEQDIAKIQITSGNSELNYLSGDGKNVRDLNLGEEIINQSSGISSLFKCYPESHFVCARVQTNLADRRNRTYFNFVPPVKENDLAFSNDTKIVMQPYLMHYVEKIPEILGFTVSENQLLEDDWACRVYVVNGIETNKYNEIIPNWNVDKLLNALELFFNIVFVVNRLTKKIRVLRVADFYNKSNKVYFEHDKVCSSVEKQYGISSDLNLLYKNVRYDFPNIDYYAFQQLDKELLNACEIKEVASYDKLDTAIHYYDYNKLILGKVSDIQMLFALQNPEAESDILLNFKQVNLFGDIETDEESDYVDLKIVPAETFDDSITINKSSTVHTVQAYTRNKEEPPETKDCGLNQYITGGLPEEAIHENIFIAIYTGLRKETYIDTNNERVTLLHPVSVTQPYMKFENYGPLWKEAEDRYSLRLDGDFGLYKRYFNNNLNIDIATEYVVTLLSTKLHDAKDIFIIDNKQFYCKQLHYKIYPEGISKEVEGTFYPM